MIYTPIPEYSVYCDHEDFRGFLDCRESATYVSQSLDEAAEHARTDGWYVAISTRRALCPKHHPKKTA